MTQTIDSKAERYLRYSHLSMVLALALILVFGALCLTSAWNPALGWVWLMRAAWLYPIGVVVAVVLLKRSTIRDDCWDPVVPEAKNVLQDEWRRTNISRAMQYAFVGVLAIQLPLGLLFSRLPSLRAVMAMAAATMMLGASSFISLFLFFARDQRDG